MLIPEAKWFAQQFRERPDAELFPLLNLGSQTGDFRTREQPWLDKYIFRPLAVRGGKVTHTDLQAADGVDVAGDLTDPAFLEQLRGMRFRSVICSNLLEHVVNREEIARLTTEVVVPGGFLFVSVPYKFPYHPDPIDTLYRPSPTELAPLFPGTDVVASEVVAGGTYATYLLGRSVSDPVTTVRRGWAAVGGLLSAPLRKPAPAVTGAPSASPTRLLPWLFKTFRTSCLVLRKHG